MIIGPSESSPNLSLTTCTQNKARTPNVSRRQSVRRDYFFAPCSHCVTLSRSSVSFLTRLISVNTSGFSGQIVKSRNASLVE